MTKWTKNQQSAISQKGSDLLVSASAGSGKTTVMIERIAQILQKGEAQADEILVLTFTKASASDMLVKLRRKLEAQGIDTDLSVMAVGTFHKFCSDLVRTYFNLVGLDPAFNVLEDVELRTMQNEILDDLIAQNYAKCREAIETFCANRKTDKLKELIVEIMDFLSTRENADGWLDNIALASYDTNLETNPSMGKVLSHIREMTNHFANAFRGFAITAETDGASVALPIINHAWKFAKVLGGAEDYAQIVSLVHSVEFPRNNKDKSFTQHDEFKSTRDDFKKKVQRIADHFQPLSELQQDKDRHIVTQTITLTREFMRAYAEEKRRRDVLDFSDMERFALEILENPEIAKTLRDKYKFIFVDEYQDTSPIQEQILTKIGRPDSVFMVGDMKQSIYGFRGCEVAIFADKLERFSKNSVLSTLGGRVVKLNENFRSNPKILEFVNSVFSKIMGEAVGVDYRATSMFQPGLEYKPPKGETAVEVVLLQKSEGEQENKIDLQCALVAKKINEIMRGETYDAREGRLRKVCLSDIAILGRNATHFLKLGTTLKKAGIPSTLVAKQKASCLFEIGMLQDFLFAVANHQNDIPLVQTMTNFIFGFTNSEVAQIKLNTEGENFWERLEDYCSKQSDELSDRLREFMMILREFNKSSKVLTVAQILDRFLTKFLVLEKLLLTPEGEVFTSRINRYLNILRNSAFAANLTRFCYLVEHGLLDIELDEGGTVTETVSITTIHKSKGLEYPIVILFDTGATFSKADSRKFMVIDKECGLCVYSSDLDEYIKSRSLARLGALLSGERAQVAEEMRLLYVALTRAKNRLVIMGALDMEKAMIPSEYDVMHAKNYWGFLTPTVLKTIPDCDFDIITINPDKVRVEERPREIRVLAGPVDESQVRELETIFAKESQEFSGANVVLKNSVTSLTKTEEIFSDHIPIPHSVARDKDRGLEYGTRFHALMQRIDLENPLADDENVRKCAQTIAPLIRGMHVLREVPILQSINQNGTQILVQGIIDLLAISNDRAILIDYKTTNAPLARILELYSPQLSMYADAVRQATGIQNIEAYIYSTRHNILIYSRGL